MRRLRDAFRVEDPWLRRVVLGMAVFAAVLSTITILKYLTFNTYAWDLGIYNQVMWSLVTGHGFQYTPEYFINPSGNYMAQHFAPDLLLLAPIYALAPSPATLLVVQSLVVALGAYPVWLLAVDRGLSRRTSSLLALSYLLYPPVWGVGWYDFHLEVLLVPAMLFAMHFWTRRRWGGFWASFLVGMFTLESAVLLVVFFGLTLALVQRRQTWAFLRRPRVRPVAAWRPLLVAGVAVAFFVAVRDVQRLLNPVIPPAFLDVYRGASYWSVLGISDPFDFPALLATIVLHPDRVASALLYAWLAKLVYLGFFLVPLLLLPLRKPVWLLPALPSFVGFFLSNYAPYYSLGYQYSAFLIPWFYIAAIAAFDPRPRAERAAHPSPFPYRDFPTRVHPEAVFWTGPTYLTVAVMFFLLLLPFAASAGIPPWFQPGLAQGSLVPSAHTSALWALAAFVPADASIVTQSNLFPAFSSRADAYVVPYIPQVAAAWSEVANHTTAPIRFVLMDAGSDPTAARFMSSTLIQPGGYGLLAKAGNAMLFERGYAGAVHVVGP